MRPRTGREPGRRTRALVVALLASAPAVVPAAAQERVPPELAVGRTVTDSLAPGEPHEYALELAARQFVLGRVDQRTVDVVVRIHGPSGDVLDSFDGPARGPEPFQFETDSAGRYTIEVAPFEEETGRYALTVERAEPVAVRPSDRVDQLMAAYAGDVPGGVVGVVRHGELVFAKGYGRADLTYDIPFTVETRTNIGSTSKQFTAFAINLLAERGELTLDDDVREHIPELPRFEETVTLRHLLTHTSGYREFLNTLALTGRNLQEGDWVDREEVIALVRRQPELQNVPGSEWNYNNTAFALLATVVERVGGKPFPDWMRENVFEPLGMEHTVVRADPHRIVENSARGYAPSEEGGWREASDLGGAMGAGGIYTTVGDLARWIGNLETGALGGEAVIERMTTPYVLADGDTTDYGFGLFIDEQRGLRRIHHGGADIAHRSMLAWYPETATGVVALSNNASFGAAARAAAVAEAFLGDAMEPESPTGPSGGEAFDPESYDPESFDPLEGRYELEEMPGFVLRFFREGDELLTQATGQPQVPMRPTSDSTFALEGVPASLTFHRNPDGSADSLTLHQNGEHVAHRLEGERWDPSASELEAYTGRYFSRELETFYHLVVEDGKLVIRHRRFGDVELTPGGERDAFTGGFPVASAEFVRSADGGVAGLTVGNGRARGIRFERVE